MSPPAWPPLRIRPTAPFRQIQLANFTSDGRTAGVERRPIAQAASEVVVMNDLIAEATLVGRLDDGQGSAGGLSYRSLRDPLPAKEQR